MNKIISGAVSGFAATVPMTGAMVAMHKMLPPEEQYPLPPRLITENALDKAEVEEHVPEEGETKLALVNHFAYGTAMGGIYAGMLDAMDAEPSAANGVAFGLGVWAFSYQALLPVAGLFLPVQHQPARRNLLMIAAHVVWGAALGIAHRKLNEDKS